MVYWEICDEANHAEGFYSEFPAGTYYIGNPEEMMLPEFFASVCYLKSGAFEDMESDGLVFVYTFNTTTFTMKSMVESDRLLVSDSKVIAVMSEDIVKPDRKYEDQRVTFKKPFLISLNTVLQEIEMKNSENIICVTHYIESDSDYSRSCGEEMDEDMYVRLYASHGIEY